MARVHIEINIAEVQRLASEGHSEAEIARRLGISEDTLQRRKRDNADFAVAIKRGKATANSNVANKLYSQCMKGNVAAIIWWEKTRCGMSETVKQEQTINEAGVRVYIPDNERDRDQTTAGAAGSVSINAG